MKNKTSFTPGPWERGRLFGTVSVPGKLIAETNYYFWVRLSTGKKANGEPVSLETQKMALDMAEECLANPRLIASAPELLEAAKDMLEALRYVPVAIDPKWESAISKAEKEAKR